MIKNMSYAALVFFLLSTSVLSQSARDRYVPERVILNLTEKPSASIAVTWRTSLEAAKPMVEYAEATDGIQYLKSTRKAAAKSEWLAAGKIGDVVHSSAVIEGLKPGGAYVYRVGSDSAWSEWNQFTTAKEVPSSFRFVWFGDPQDDIREHVSRVFQEAYKIAPDAAFWSFSGDLTSEPDDYRFGELFYAAGYAFRMIPSVMTPGNHDMGYKTENGKIALDARNKKIRTNSVSALWRAHFTLPENGIPDYPETSYYFDYQGLRTIMVNSNEKLEDQAAWMENLLSNNPNKWTIVTFHHPLYSYGRDRDERSTRNAFLRLFDKYHVDLVLTGHDHTYARGHKLSDGAIATNNEKGTVYVVSSSGPKFYAMNPRYEELMAKTAADLQLFQVVSVSENMLTMKAYTAAGALFDSFEIAK